MVEVVNFQIMSIEEGQQSFVETTTKKAKEIASKLISIAIQLGCLIFVIVQTYKCASKFAKHPQGTEIRIIKGYNDTYPYVTICPLILTDNPFESILKECNLTYDAYFKNGQWKGSSKSEGYCQKPEELFATLAENSFDQFSMTFMDFESYEYEVSDFDYKDHSEFGRCLTFDYIVPVASMHLHTQATTFQIFISTPGYFLSSEYHSVLLEPDYDRVVRVAREVIEVLDYEGKDCMHSLDRDDCIYDYIDKNLTDTIGCTTPYVKEKSKICTDQSEAKKAMAAESQIMQDETTLEEICPRSCWEVHANFGSKESYFNGEDGSDFYLLGNLTIEFHQFVKVSKSYWEYDAIELIAEVGGYVGLFLGVSVNQIRLPIGKLFSS